MPAINVKASGPTTFNPGGSVNLTAVNNFDEDALYVPFSYQWTRNGVNIDGLTDLYCTATTTGAYSLNVKVNGQLIITTDPVMVNVVFSLPADNFNVAVTSATCKGSNNGYIDINAAQQYNYSAIISSDTTHYKFTKSLEIKNLKAGTYNLCITVSGHPEYQQCYTLIVTEPKDLAVYSTVNVKDKTVDLNLSGGDIYQIAINDQVYTSTQAQISLPLQKGNNTLSVTTGKDCQGTYVQQIVMGNTITVYPVPFADNLNIDIGNDESKTANVFITDIYGKQVYNNRLATAYGKININLTSLPPGIYMLKLTLDSSTSSYKIIKN